MIIAEGKTVDELHNNGTESREVVVIPRWLITAVWVIGVALLGHVVRVEIALSRVDGNGQNIEKLEEKTENLSAMGLSIVRIETGLSHLVSTTDEIKKRVEQIERSLPPRKD